MSTIYFRAPSKNQRKEKQKDWSWKPPKKPPRFPKIKTTAALLLMLAGCAPPQQADPKLCRDTISKVGIGMKSYEVKVADVKEGVTTLAVDQHRFECWIEGDEIIVQYKKALQ